MVSRKVIVKNADGLHLRTAKKLIDKTIDFKSSVTIIFRDTRIDAKSIINIMLACIKCGSEIEIECEGEDEQQALEAAVDVIENGLE